MVLCKPPSLIYAEIKGPKGKLTERQRLFLDTLSQVPGIEVYLWREEHLEDIYLRLAGQPHGLERWHSE